MTRMNHDGPRGRVVIGVDTHKHVHVAAALSDIGAVLEARRFPADAAGYQELIGWAKGLGHLLTFAIEGTGSYGAGLTSAVQRSGIGAIEVMRTDRRDRRLRGKSDTLDAENAARAVLAGHATAIPKTADGAVEMIRTIKVAKDVAVKARTSAMISLKQVLVNAPPELREELQPLTKMALLRRCAARIPGPMDCVQAAAVHTLRSIARRWLDLDEEISEHERILGELTAQLVPDLIAAFGIGTDVAAELLIVAGDNIDRVRSEAAWARLCGVAPIPASSGMTTRHRLNRGGHRQANAALYRTVIVRMQHQPRPTSLDGPPKARPRRRSSAACNASSPEKPGHSCDPCASSVRTYLWLLDSYRSINALMECVIGLFKTECIRTTVFHHGAYRTIADVEWATAGWVDWWNNRRLHSSLDYLSPNEFEQARYAVISQEPQPA